MGLDAVRMSLEQFFSEQGLKYTASKVSALGGEAEVFKVLYYYRSELLKLFVAGVVIYRVTLLKSFGVHRKTTTPPTVILDIIRFFSTTSLH